ncbi:class I SAM-dependent methyltransferase [Mesorhizobium sp. DCY119]|uniref:class I SAM-dependent methyltransferase n=1 Tax=Mesorhizobium sp. DCY119 TaxID=2108445 RepID=UPI000E6CFDFA|nr:class I SAM-dependent methyltransferase [Mesorhizobium sp. DCY119]RJG46198.1 class I SAM-dependent methyltransferase [Mesorhizobium sp. DCY119]
MVTSAMNDEQSNALLLAAYNQNWETFRSLNNLMWQIPLIAMTLTGGLWFGVSTVKDMPFFAAGLLFLAGCGNVGLMLTLRRLRYIMAQYLQWSKTTFAAGHVSAPGGPWFTGNETVRHIFQTLLGLAATTSFVLLVVTMTENTLPHGAPAGDQAIAYYDRHAEELADSYEGISFENTHPALASMLAGKPPMRILDVGAGTGRDAAALAQLGHHVVAVDPSANMLKLAQTLHRDTRIEWLSDALPGLNKVRGEPFDIVLLSAVWMHIPPSERAQALRRISALITPSGKIYISLRMGPGDPARGIWPVSSDEVDRLAATQGLTMTNLGAQPDLLGRAEVYWETLLVGR